VSHVDSPINPRVRDVPIETCARGRGLPS
jgi:hypothetical protein